MFPLFFRISCNIRIRYSRNKKQISLIFSNHVYEKSNNIQKVGYYTITKFAESEKKGNLLEEISIVRLLIS